MIIGILIKLLRRELGRNNKKEGMTIILLVKYKLKQINWMWKKTNKT